MTRLGTGITQADVPRLYARHDAPPPSPARRTSAARLHTRGHHAASGSGVRLGGRRLTPQAVFLALWLIFATLVAVLAPLGAGFDETMHVARVAQISEGVLLPQPVEAEDVAPDAAAVPRSSEYELYGGAEDRALQELVKRGNAIFQTADLAGEPLAFPWWSDPRFQDVGSFGEGEVTWAFPNTAINSPVVYLPYVLGYLASTALTGNLVVIGIVTRLCGVVFFGAAMWLAISRAPVGRWLMAAVALAPISLLDNAFVTADMMTFAFVALFVSGALRLALTSDGSAATWALVAISGCGIAVAKLTYLPFGLLVFLAPLLRPELRDRRSWAKVAAICVAALACFLLWFSQISDINTGALWSATVDPGAQLAHVLENPVGYLWLYVRQLFEVDVLASTSAWSVPYPAWLTTLVYLAAILADLGSVPGGVAARLRRRPVAALLLAVWLVVGFLIVLALYLQFTSVGAPEVDGVQVRYFLPLVFPLLTAVTVALAPRARAGSGGARRSAGTVALLAAMPAVLLIGLLIRMH